MSSASVALRSPPTVARGVVRAVVRERAAVLGGVLGGVMALAAWGCQAQENPAQALGTSTNQASGLTLAHSGGTTLWPHWEGRIGVVLDRTSDPLRAPFVLAGPGSGGLKLHSLHLLSDYYFAGGFRATAGLVRGSASHPWWPTSQQGSTGLNLSMQRLEMLGLPGTPQGTNVSDDPNRTMTYVGAGYSTRLADTRVHRTWQFNADLGLISLNSRNIGRIGRVLQGDQGVEDLLRDLRLRPVVKITVNYAF